MKVKISFLMLLLCFLAFPLSACKENGTLVEPPEAPAPKVNSVAIYYQDVQIPGMLSVDLSMKTVSLSAIVQKTDESVDGTVAFASSVPEIASITDTGVVTLKTEGETVISATAGDKKHEIVLAVGNDYAPAPQQYLIVVLGGTSDKTSAAEGTFVTLNAVVPEHMKFVEWEYKIGEDVVTDLWINGNIIAMPDGDITVTAKYEDMLYTLNVIGGTVKDDVSGELEGDVMVYKYKYDTAITTVANPEPSDKMFVGWDYKVKNNRVGELGVTEYGPFVMPDKTLTVWAVHSPRSAMGFPGKPVAPVGKDAYNDAINGFKLITNGVPSEEAADPDLQGMSGYRLAINGNTNANIDYTNENIQGSNLSNLVLGSQTIKAIFKNHHATLPVTVELFANQYNIRATTGIITIPAGQVVTKTFMANLGFNNPYFGINVRENVGGVAGDYVLLDMVVQKAATYPDGDKQFEVSGVPEWVNLSSFTVGGTFAGIKGVNNSLGMSQILGWETSIVPNSYVRASVTNMPEFNPDDSITKVYFKVINASDNKFTFKLNFGTTLDPRTGEEGSSLGSYDMVIEAKAVNLFAIEIPRTNNNQIYFSIIKPILDYQEKTGYGIIFQMAYNNVIGVQE